MRTIDSHCGSPTYQLSKYLTTILQPLTNENRHKVQSTKHFIDTIKTVQIPDDYKLVAVHQNSTSTGPGLHRDSHQEIDSRTTATQRRHNRPTQTFPNLLFLSVQGQTLQTTTRHGHGLTGFRCCGRNRHAEHRTTSPGHVQRNTATLVTLR